MADIATLQIQVETKDVAAAQAALKSLGVEAKVTETKVGGLGEAAKKNRGAFRAMRGSVQQLGFQVQDIAVQLQAGTSAITVFTQQGSQIAALFGPGGAVFGAVLAIAGAITGALVGSMNRAKEEAKDLASELDKLIEASREMTEAQRVRELPKLYLALSESVSKARAANKELNLAKLEGSAQDAETIQRLNDLRAVVDDETKLQGDLKEAIAILRGERYLSSDAVRDNREEAEKLVKKLEEEAKAAGMTAEQLRIYNLELKKQEAITKTYGAANRDLKERAIIAADTLIMEEKLAQEKESIEQRKRDAIKKTREQEKSYQEQFKLDEKTRLEEQRIVNQGLLSLEDNLLKNKTDKQKAGYRVAVNLLDQEKRTRAVNIVSTSYEAAMKAYAAMAGIPIIGPALGAAAAATVIAAGVSFAAQSLAGRALGGQVRAGESYVVGERGPEILTMGSTGRITPNDKIQTSQTEVGNRNVNVSFNISTVDAAGFDTLLQSRRGQIIGIINTAMNERGRPALA
jgi:hypothetical protein